MEQRSYGVDVECTPNQIPGTIEIDVSELTEGSALHAGDLKLPDGVELRTTKDQTIAAVGVVRAAVLTPQTEETPVGEEALTEGEADAAPAEGGAEEKKPAE